jgi:type I restriction-modification system DNA methylase subunit
MHRNNINRAKGKILWKKSISIESLRPTSSDLSISKGMHAGVSMEEIEKNGYNLNISRYVSTSEDEVKIDLKEINKKLISINESIKTNRDKHNEFLKELGLPPI